MLGWIERMVPQPPGTPHHSPLVEKMDKKAEPRRITVEPRPGEAEQVSREQPGEMG